MQGCEKHNGIGVVTLTRVERDARNSGAGKAINGLSWNVF